VEVGVQVVQRWILARLRNRKFFELGELNQAIWELLDELNARPFQKLEGSRESAFAALDKPALRPLPPVRYELAERKTRRVNIDYHVEYDGRYYSVPYERVHAEVEVRATATVVEIFQAGERLASHRRGLERRGSMVTEPGHRPENHRHQVWPPERLIAWGASFGPSVARVVELTLGRYVNPEQGYRACLGLMRTAQRHGAARMNAACERALSVSIVGGPRRKHIEAILKRSLEREGVPVAPTPRASPLTHENVRGGDYYDKETVH
jgi:transposase